MIKYFIDSSNNRSHIYSEYTHCITETASVHVVVMCPSNTLGITETLLLKLYINKPIESFLKIKLCDV